MNKEELMQVHNFLMQIEVKGDNAIYLAESLVRIRKILNEPVDAPVNGEEE